LRDGNTDECHPVGPCGSQDATETQVSAILWAHVAHRMPLKHSWVLSYGPMWLTGCHWNTGECHPMGPCGSQDATDLCYHISQPNTMWIG